MHRGYIKLWRKLIDWEWFSDSNTLHLFIYLIIKASYQDCNFKGRKIIKGQCIFGRLKASEDTGLSEQSIRTSLKRLKSTSEITIETTNKFSIVTLCNFDIYNPEKDDTNQQFNQQINQQLTSNQPATNQQLTTYKEVIEVNNNNNTSIPTLTGKKISTQPEWKKRCTTFEEYKKWELEEYHKIINDTKWILERRGFNKPVYKRQLNITETIRKAHIDYWGTEQGYKKIKSRKGKTIDWKSTWNNALTMRCNQVWEDVETDNSTEDQYTVL